MALTIVLMMMMMMMMMMLSRTIGVSGEKSYRIQHQCEKKFCFQLWKPYNLTLVTNGQIQSAASEVEEPKCSVLIDPFTDQEHVCRRKPGEFITTEPRQSVTLQCALLRYFTTSNYFTPDGLLRVWWVDENQSRLQVGQELRVTRNSDCDVTLTVSFQSPKNASFRCLVTVNGARWITPKIGVILPSGRRILPPVTEGPPQTQNLTLVLVLVSVALITTATILVICKRRARTGRGPGAGERQDPELLQTGLPVYENIRTGNRPEAELYEELRLEEVEPEYCSLHQIYPGLNQD